MELHELRQALRPLHSAVAAWTDALHPLGLVPIGTLDSSEYWIGTATAWPTLVPLVQVSGDVAHDSRRSLQRLTSLLDRATGIADTLRSADKRGCTVLHLHLTFVPRDVVVTVVAVHNVLADYELTDLRLLALLQRPLVGADVEPTAVATSIDHTDHNASTDERSLREPDDEDVEYDLDEELDDLDDDLERPL